MKNGMKFLLVLIFGTVVGGFLYLPYWSDMIARSHDRFVITKVEQGTFSAHSGPYGVSHKVDGWFVTLSDGSQWAVLKKYNIAFGKSAEYTPIIGEKLDGNLKVSRTRN